MIVSLIRVCLLTWARVRPAWCLACARVSPMGTPRLHCSAVAPIAPAEGAGGFLLPCPHARRGTGLPAVDLCGHHHTRLGGVSPDRPGRPGRLLRDLAGLNSVQGGGHLGGRGLLADAETGEHALAVLLFQ